MEYSNCVDWKKTSVQKFTSFAEDLNKIAPNFYDWAVQAAKNKFVEDSSIDEETYILFFIATTIHAETPADYMNCCEEDTNHGMMSAEYYNYLLWKMQDDLSLIEEVGLL